ncbi:MAG: DUF4422 domain-containing protein [Puniceicoccales bacterium]|jgi:lipopolysaccharide biosynthesis glycosyltransferase|nr:DUF4422 domain-containing protein [Puniceicoccales bacterium]
MERNEQPQQTQQRCQIFLAYHRPTTLLANDFLTPIHVGAINSPVKICDVRDDSGPDHISAKNASYCELTTQYWAWKNCSAEYIGFMHYRRHFIFDVSSEQKEDIYGVVYYKQMDANYSNAIGLTVPKISALLENYDLILPRKWNVKNANSPTVYDHYKSSSPHLHIADYDAALKILAKKYPEYKNAADAYNAGSLGYFTNMFVMRRELLNEYCEWLFSILAETEKHVDLSKYNTQEKRVFGYISEWLFGIFVTHKLKTKKNLRAIELQKTFVQDTAKPGAIAIDVCGSCASTEIFYHPELQAKTETDGIIRLGSYGARQSMLSMVQPPMGVSASEFEYPTNFVRDMLMGVFNKTFLSGIEKKHASYLLIDLLSERFDVAIWNGHTFDTSIELKNSGFLNGKDVQVLQRMDYINKNLDKWRESINAFCEKVAKVYLPENILVYRCFLVDTYRDADGNIFDFTNDDIHYNNIANLVLAWAYEKIIEKLKGCFVIEIPANTIADGTSRWGMSGSHYTNEIYLFLYETVCEQIKKREQIKKKGTVKASETAKKTIIKTPQNTENKEGGDSRAEQSRAEQSVKYAAPEVPKLAAPQMPPIPPAVHIPQYPHFKIKPAFAKNNIAVCIAFDEKFAPYASVLIQSIIKHASPNNNYDIVILHTDVSEKSKNRFLLMAKQKANFSIRLIETTPFFAGIHLPTHMHMGKETYYRMRIPSIFSTYKKVLYLDTDTIVCHDLADLFNVELGNNFFAAVPCYIMKGFRKLKIRAIREVGGQESDKYLREYVGIKEPENYFQAGVLLFNAEALRAENVEEKFIRLISGKRFWFLDQDILNKVAEGHVTLLEYKWNTAHGNGDINTFFVQFPFDVFEKYIEARKDPFIIHFAGDKKPWKVPDIDFADRFWLLAEKTPWRKELLTLRDDLRSGRATWSPERRLANYHQMSKDPFISAYRKLRRTFGVWPHNTAEGSTEKKIIAYHTITKDPVISLYRKLRKTFGTWQY